MRRATVTDTSDGSEYDLCGRANLQRRALEFTFILQAEIALAGHRENAYFA
jgi:hypothetical protein